MANQIKDAFLNELASRYGSLRRIQGSRSMFEVGKGAARIYIRYSKVHGGDRAFFGLRKEDLRDLEGHPSIICFLWDGQQEPLLVPYSEYESVIQSTTPALDGQYKPLIFIQPEGIQLYFPKAGRFNVESHIGWDSLDALIDSSNLVNVPVFTHGQIQTLLGAIGVAKGYDIWVPTNDRPALDWSIAKRFEFRDALPYGFEQVRNILEEVDVVWIQRGASFLSALFEVEHSTPIYSGLLRFNDIHLAARNLHSKFSIVANESRRDLFARQLNRPTFKTSGLTELCTFLEYQDVFGWHKRVNGGKAMEEYATEQKSQTSMGSC